MVEVLYRYVYGGAFFVKMWNNKVQFNENIWLEMVSIVIHHVLLQKRTSSFHGFTLLLTMIFKSALRRIYA